jgi:hypothetical protein
LMILSSTHLKHNYCQHPAHATAVPQTGSLAHGQTALHAQPGS